MWVWFNLKQQSLFPYFNTSEFSTQISKNSQI